MLRYRVLSDCITDDSIGIFSALSDLGVPWSDTVSSEVLDDTYMTTYSGGKPPSPAVLHMALLNNGPLTDSQIRRLARMIHAINSPDWLRSWEAEEADYNPISNYDMREELTDDIREHEEIREGGTTYGHTVTRTDDLSDTYGDTHTRTDNLTDGYGSTDTRTDNLTRETEGEASRSEDTNATHSVYGLNSSDPVPSDVDTTLADIGETTSDTVTDTGTQTLAKTGSDTHTGTQTMARTGTDTHTGTRTDAHSGSDTTEDSRSSTDTHSYVLTRTGNIGVTTSQQMLEAERTLRAWRLFYDRVFPDLDKMLTLCTY